MTTQVKVTYLSVKHVHYGLHPGRAANITVEVRPFRIIRESAGKVGAALTRYYYFCYFDAPADASDVRTDKISGRLYVRARIRREFNKAFNPKKYVFVNDVCELETVMEAGVSE